MFLDCFFIQHIILICALIFMCSCDRLEVRTLRCGRNNPGSNPGHGSFLDFLLTVVLFWSVSEEVCELFLTMPVRDLELYDRVPAKEKKRKRNVTFCSYNSTAKLTTKCFKISTEWWDVSSKSFNTFKISVKGFKIKFLYIIKSKFFTKTQKLFWNKNNKQTKKIVNVLFTFLLLSALKFFQERHDLFMSQNMARISGGYHNVCQGGSRRLYVSNPFNWYGETINQRFQIQLFVWMYFIERPK